MLRINKIENNKKAFLLFAILLFCIPTFGHTINYQFEDRPTSDVFGYYTWLGFQHILPNGFDHILFVFGLFLLNPKLKSVIAQASCFTIAHTVTLILSANGTIQPNSNIIEPIIALSIVFIAIENLFTTEMKATRYLVIFGFGLIHGMGFATALNDIGLPRDAFYTSLMAFNVGVELGQITILVAAYFLIGKLFSEKIWYRQRVVYPLSIGIALIAGFWTIERLFFIS